MRGISRRLHRLEENQLLGADGKPRKTSRIAIGPLDGKVDLANSTCQRTLCADGSVSESLVLFSGNKAREITDDELEEWVGGFPIEVPDGRIRPRRLPPPPAPVE
jgi:hypothetical protein